MATYKLYPTWIQQGIFYNSNLNSQRWGGLYSDRDSLNNYYVGLNENGAPRCLALVFDYSGIAGTVTSATLHFYANHTKIIRVDWKKYNNMCDWIQSSSVGSWRCYWRDGLDDDNNKDTVEKYQKEFTTVVGWNSRVVVGSGSGATVLAPYGYILCPSEFGETGHGYVHINKGGEYTPYLIVETTATVNLPFTFTKTVSGNTVTADFAHKQLGAYDEIILKESGTLRFTTAPQDVSYTIVGGGGGGGQPPAAIYYCSGGGGGGEVKVGSAEFNANTNYSITVGAGGDEQTNGANSILVHKNGTVTARGGEAGKRGVGSAPHGAGGAGGNGGGGGMFGSNWNNDYGKGGSGGSAGTQGASDGNAPGGASWNTGTTKTRHFNEAFGLYYAGGGGGGLASTNSKLTTGGQGGWNGGGNGSNAAKAWHGRNGFPNTGGGGGGGSNTNAEGVARAGKGGSGVVIIRYRSNNPNNTSTRIVGTTYGYDSNKIDTYIDYSISELPNNAGHRITATLKTKTKSGEICTYSKNNVSHYLKIDNSFTSKDTNNSTVSVNYKNNYNEQTIVTLTKDINHMYAQTVPIDGKILYGPDFLTGAAVKGEIQLPALFEPINFNGTLGVTSNKGTFGDYVKISRSGSPRATLTFSWPAASSGFNNTLTGYKLFNGSTLIGTYGANATSATYDITENPKAYNFKIQACGDKTPDNGTALPIKTITTFYDLGDFSFVTPIKKYVPLGTNSVTVSWDTPSDGSTYNILSGYKLNNTSIASTVTSYTLALNTTSITSNEYSLIASGSVPAYIKEASNSPVRISTFEIANDPYDIDYESNYINTLEFGMHTPDIIVPSDSGIASSQKKYRYRIFYKNILNNFTLLQEYDGLAFNEPVIISKALLDTVGGYGILTYFKIESYAYIDNLDESIPLLFSTITTPPLMRGYLPKYPEYVTFSHTSSNFNQIDNVKAARALRVNFTEDGDVSYSEQFAPNGVFTPITLDTITYRFNDQDTISGKIRPTSDYNIEGVNVNIKNLSTGITNTINNCSLVTTSASTFLPIIMGFGDNLEITLNFYHSPDDLPDVKIYRAKELEKTFLLPGELTFAPEQLTRNLRVNYRNEYSSSLYDTGFDIIGAINSEDWTGADLGGYKDGWYRLECSTNNGESYQYLGNWELVNIKVVSDGIAKIELNDVSVVTGCLHHSSIIENMNVPYSLKYRVRLKNRYGQECAPSPAITLNIDPRCAVLPQSDPIMNTTGFIYDASGVYNLAGPVGQDKSELIFNFDLGYVPNYSSSYQKVGDKWYLKKNMINPVTYTAYLERGAEAIKYPITNYEMHDGGSYYTGAVGVIAINNVGGPYTLRVVPTTVFDNNYLITVDNSGTDITYPKTAHRNASDSAEAKFRFISLTAPSLHIESIKRSGTDNKNLVFKLSSVGSIASPFDLATTTLFNGSDLGYSLSLDYKLLNGTPEPRIYINNIQNVKSGTNNFAAQEIEEGSPAAATYTGLFEADKKYELTFTSSLKYEFFKSSHYNYQTFEKELKSTVTYILDKINPTISLRDGQVFINKLNDGTLGTTAVYIANNDNGDILLHFHWDGINVFDDAQIIVNPTTGKIELDGFTIDGGNW